MANPDTCEHWLAIDVAEEGSIITFICASCESTLSPEYRNEFKWDFDLDYNIWRRRANLLSRWDLIVGFRTSDGRFYAPEDVTIVYKTELPRKERIENGEPVAFVSDSGVEWAQAPGDSEQS